MLVETICSCSPSGRLLLKAKIQGNCETQDSKYHPVMIVDEISLWTFYNYAYPVLHEMVSSSFDCESGMNAMKQTREFLPRHVLAACTTSSRSEE